MKYLSLLLSLIAFANVHAQKCDDIKQGKFRIATNDNIPESILTRTADYQFEDVPSLGIKMQYSLKWTSDCSYELSNGKLIKGELPGFSDNGIVYVKIIKVSSGYYSAEVSSNFNDFKKTVDIQIIK